MAEQKRSFLKTWKKILPFMKPYRGKLIFGMIVMLLSSIVDTVLPLFSGYAVDNFVEPRSSDGIIPFAILYFLLITAVSIFTFLFARIALQIEMYMNRDIRKALFTHLQELDFTYYNSTPVGTILARVMSDTSRISGVVSWSLVDFFYSGGYIVFCLIVMLTINWKLARLVVSIVPFIALVTFFFQKKILAVNRNVRKINADITRQFNEGISGAMTTKTLGIEQQNLDAFEQTTGDMRKETIRSIMLDATYVPILSFLTSLAVSFVLTAGGSEVLNSTLSVGTMTVFINYALVISDPVQQLASTISRFLSAQVNVERCTDLLEIQPMLVDRPEVIAVYGDEIHPKKENWEPVEGHITFEDVTFCYPDGHENVLEHFYLDVPAGKTIAIVGETGAGKSTLVNLACRFFEPTEGRILIDGKDYRERSILWLHSNLGYVLQTPHLFSGTVMDNIRYGKLDATDEEVYEAAKMVRAHEMILNLPDGYQSNVGEGGSQLSTGQKQLVSFARAVLANPRIFVLDEATASIDTETEAKIQYAISTLLGSRTSFVIAHRLSTIRKADLILVVRDGKIMERGTHEELMQQGGYYAGLYRRQFSVQGSEASL